MFNKFKWMKKVFEIAIDKRMKKQEKAYKQKKKK